MAFHEIKVPDNASVLQKLLAWVDSRFPLSSTIKAHLTGYYAPKISIFGMSLALLRS